MRKNISYLSIILLLISFQTVFAGNPDRVGQAGATELTINPWARSSGWHGAFQAGIGGVEAMRFNPAGIVSVPNTEFLVSRTTWLGGSDIYINAFGFAKKLGDDEEAGGSLGLSLMTFDFGDIEVTTVDQPEGGIGTYSPQFVNIGVTYAHKFSNRIRTGITFRVISQSIPDASAQGICFDAGLQYVTDFVDEEKQRTRFGISLRNVGTPMKFTGDGLTRRGQFEGEDITLSVTSRSSGFELPTMVNIGFAQDFHLTSDMTQILTFAANFASNSFTNDQVNVGLQYSWKKIVSLRAGYAYEKDVYDEQNRMSAYTGPAGGFSVNIPFGKDKDRYFSVDYSYRATEYFTGTHSFGARIIL